MFILLINNALSFGKIFFNKGKKVMNIIIGSLKLQIINDFTEAFKHNDNKKIGRAHV